MVATQSVAGQSVSTQAVSTQSVSTQAEALRKAIENLIDAKLLDAMSKPGGLDRLLAHRRTGVASFDIRQAERKLQDSIAEMLVSNEPAYSH
jgi:phage tail sheath gpL-like